MAECIDLDQISIRELNQRLHGRLGTAPGEWRIVNPRGKHSVAVGVDAEASISIEGHVGYYCAGMNKLANVTIDGHAGVGVAENMMSGSVRVKGNAGSAAGATGRGGLLVIEGDAGLRCGISMKGVDIVVRGSAGYMSGFMAQAGNMVICGDAGAALGDSIYEARIYVGGKVADLGADCVEKEMTDEHLEHLSQLLQRAGFDHSPSSFRRYGSARKLYNFHIDHVGEY